MEKINITTNWKALQYIVLSRSFQSVQKKVAECTEICKDSDEHSTLVNIDNQLTDIINTLANIIGYEIIKDN